MDVFCLHFVVVQLCALQKSARFERLGVSCWSETPPCLAPIVLRLDSAIFVATSRRTLFPRFSSIQWASQSTLNRALTDQHVCQWTAASGMLRLHEHARETKHRRVNLTHEIQSRWLSPMLFSRCYCSQSFAMNAVRVRTVPVSL